MRFSRKTEYALRALIAMARRGGTGQIPELARAEHIPDKFLEQILLSLRRAGILTSKRGVRGGYAFRLPPSQVTVGAVVAVVDGPTAPVPCAAVHPVEPCTCPEPARCPVRGLMVKLRELIDGLLGCRTIDDLVNAAPPPHAPSYDI